MNNDDIIINWNIVTELITDYNEPLKVEVVPVVISLLT